MDSTVHCIFSWLLIQRLQHKQKTKNTSLYILIWILTWVVFDLWLIVLLRWGYCHVINNYYNNWKYYAIGGRAHAKILSELNVFKPGARLEVTPWFEQFKSDVTPTIQSSKDLLMKGATFHQFLNYGPLSFLQSEFRPYKLPRRPTGSLVDLVTNCSGVIWGPKLELCLATPWRRAIARKTFEMVNYHWLILLSCLHCSALCFSAFCWTFGFFFW